VALSVEAAVFDATSLQAPPPVLAYLLVIDAPMGSWSEEHQPVGVIKAYLHHIVFVGEKN